MVRDREIYAYISIGIVILLCIGATCNEGKVYTYRHYLSDKENILSVNTLMENNSYESALTLLNDNQCKRFSCIEEQLVRWRLISKTKDSDKALEYLLNAISCGLVFTESIFNEQDRARQNQIEEATKNFNSKLDIEFVEWLNEAVAADQSIRELWRAARKSSDTVALNKIIEEVKATDTRNSSGLQQYVKKNGWPGVNTIGRVGGMYNLPPSLLVKHYNKPLNNFFLNEIIKAAEKGEEDWSVAEEVQENIIIRFKNLDGFRSINLSEFPKVTDRSLLELRAC
jgi:hypothetical protein